MLACYISTEILLLNFSYCSASGAKPQTPTRGSGPRWGIFIRPHADFVHVLFQEMIGASPEAGE